MTRKQKRLFNLNEWLFADTGDLIDCDYEEIRMLNDTLNLTNRKQAEIEQWKEEANKYQTLWCMAVDGIKTAKSRAIQEFAERLKAEINIRPTHSKEQNKYVCFLIDNLVKEMTRGE